MSDVARVLDRLAAFEPTDLPFLSIYVDARPDNTGRERWQASVRKELGERIDTGAIVTGFTREGQYVLQVIA